MTNYNVYTYSRKEKVKYSLIGICIFSVIGILFYRSVWAVLVFAPFTYFYLKYKKNQLIKERKWQFNQQFRQGILSLSSALNAGYSIENAFLEATTDLELMYEKNADIVREFVWINQKIALNKTVEDILEDLAERTRVEDVESFVEVFKTAKRTGGDLMKVIAQTEKNIGEKIEVQRELETLISAKKLEANIMSMVPFGIIMYLWVASPGFLDPLYGNLLGCTAMTVLLGVYMAAYFLMQKIIDSQL